MNRDLTQATSSAAVLRAEQQLAILLPGMYRERIDEVKPVSMGSAPLAFDVEGNVAWDRMWGSFCDLAMAGGPPHKGKLLEPGRPASIQNDPARYQQVCSEITRGVQLAAGLQVSSHPLPGWVKVRCQSLTMAEWLLRAITMENVSVRLEGSFLLLPAGPEYRLEKEIKNVITVIAKTVHYWSGHLTRVQQLRIADLFYELNAQRPLLGPAWQRSSGDTASRKQIEAALTDATGLPTAPYGYSDWTGVVCGSVQSAVVTMRRLVASNILCRREETSIFLPLNSDADPGGTRLARTVAELVDRRA